MSPPSACVDHPHHDPPQIYDDCTPPNGVLVPTECRIPARGAMVCGAHWTTTCRVDADCPETMTCVDNGSASDGPWWNGFGHCEKRCSSAGDCVRCDLTCGAGGYCVGGDLAT